MPNVKTKKHTSRIEVRVSPALKEALKAEAYKRDSSPAKVVRDFIRTLPQPTNTEAQPLPLESIL